MYWCKYCCKKLFHFYTAPGVPLDCISMYFFVVSETVLCLSKLIYSDLLMDSKRKRILQFCVSLRVFLLRPIYQRVWPQLPVCSCSHLSRVPLSGCWCSNVLKILVEKWGLRERSGLQSWDSSEGRKKVAIHRHFCYHKCLWSSWRKMSSRSWFFPFFLKEQTEAFWKSVKCISKSSMSEDHSPWRIASLILISP